MRWRREITVHEYARVVGVGLVLLGVAELFIIDVFRSSSTLLHLSTGTLLVYVGFRKDARVVRGVLTGLGILYLLAGMLIPTWNLLEGLPVELYENGEDLFHVAFGLLNVLAAMALASKDDTLTVS